MQLLYEAISLLALGGAGVTDNLGAAAMALINAQRLLHFATLCTDLEDDLLLSHHQLLSRIISSSVMLDPSYVEVVRLRVEQCRHTHINCCMAVIARHLRLEAFCQSLYKACGMSKDAKRRSNQLLGRPHHATLLHCLGRVVTHAAQ